MLLFEWAAHNYSINPCSVDATKPDSRLGRLVNDSAHPNAVMKKVEVDGSPHLCLFALRDIAVDEEIRYDYGVNDLPWRLEVQYSHCCANLVEHDDVFVVKFNAAITLNIVPLLYFCKIVL